MQTRPYDEKEGRRVWLSKNEQEQLVDVYRDEKPRRAIALLLGLHGLRTDEVVQVQPQHVRRLDSDTERYKLVIPDGKTGKRETPISTDLRQRIHYLKNASQMRQADPVIDVGKRSVRNWIYDAREQLADEADDEGVAEAWMDLGMHDLRRTFATDTYYTLAFEGVPIAEELTMGWGGWTMNERGRETFRENYLGPEPDHIADRAMDRLGYD